MASLVYHFHPEVLQNVDKSELDLAREERATHPQASGLVQYAIESKLESKSQVNIRALVVAKKQKYDNTMHIIGTFGILTKSQMSQYIVVAKRLISKPDGDLKQVERMIGRRDDYKMFTRHLSSMRQNNQIDSSFTDVVVILFFDENYQNRIAYNLVEDFETLLIANFDSDTLPSLETNGLHTQKSFARKCNELIKLYEEPAKSGIDRIASLQSKIDISANNCYDASIAIVKNSEDLKTVLEKSEALKDETKLYNDRTNELKWKMFRKNLFWTIMLLIGIVAIIIGLLSVFHII